MELTKELKAIFIETAQLTTRHQDLAETKFCLNERLGAL